MKVTMPMMSLALAVATAAAHGNAGGRSRLAPRHYQYSRVPDSIGVVSEIFSSPIYNLASKLIQQEIGGDTSVSGPRYAVTNDKESGVSTLRMELPGVSPSDLEIELENDSLLRVKGSRKLLTTGQAIAFDQTFQLDEGVDSASIKVTLQNGILEVTASKKAKTVKRLEIRISEDDSTTETATTETVAEGQSPDELTIVEEE